MRMQTNFKGRMKNTTLPKSWGLMPLYEAVVNSIQSIDEAKVPTLEGRIQVEILREPNLPLESKEDDVKSALQFYPEITGFTITDNGIGFDKTNFNSFLTLDSDHKGKMGCRGIGRVLWLKAFGSVQINSVFLDKKGGFREREFTFTQEGVSDENDNVSQKTQRSTYIHLQDFKKEYRDESPKTADVIVNGILDHCLWYFVRSGGAPEIILLDADKKININQLCDGYLCEKPTTKRIKIKHKSFDLMHVKHHAKSSHQTTMALCASKRLVKEESLAGKVPGLYGTFKGEDGEFTYTCYVTSKFLDDNVHPERTEFYIPESNKKSNKQISLDIESISLNDIREAVLTQAQIYLSPYLEANVKVAKDRVHRFIAEKSPRYRPVLGRMPDAAVNIDPKISDKSLELHLHKSYAQLERDFLEQGHDLMRPKDGENAHEYERRLKRYMGQITDFKKSDLANYLFHRKAILDVLENAIKQKSDGKYAYENIIHELIMPMRKTSDEVFVDECNLWLINERLAFHEYLASDKPLGEMPITGDKSNREPDVCALNVYDKSLLVSDDKSPLLASIFIVELKRPMRNDAKADRKHDPIDQSIDYLERIRKGGVKTKDGRIIPQGSETVPGYIYVVCDITPTITERCKKFGLIATQDYSGYFGYLPNYHAYVEVNSFDRILASANQRHKAFFDKLDLPTK